MHILDSIVLVATLAFIVIFGYYQTRGSKNVSDFLKGGNEARWWTVGLSVMATQASAITFLSAPGQAFHSGMGFVQFYLGVPIAMIVICMFFIPIYHRLKVYTAYEYLESRFDLKTRTLTALLFLIQRGLAAGITIFAPSIILSAVLGWNLITLNIIIGSLVVIYTVSGGTKAVSVTQKQQMGIIFLGLIIAFVLIVNDLPQDITFSNALEIAAANDKLNVLDFSFEWDNRYTFWSGLIGGTFLALSYFGTDQSQVQRYLSASSLKESQMGLIFNGFLKVPMQFFILLIGVMMFVFYQFNASPLNFNPAGEKEVLNSEYADEYRQLQQELENNRQEKVQLNYALINTEEKAPIQQEIRSLNKKEENLRAEGVKLIDKTEKDVETNDKDYVFIHFILNNLPKGLIGLLLAVILSAAMSSTASELNSLASTTTIDLYKRNVSSDKSDQHFLNASRFFTLIWGILAVIIACTADLFDNLIQLVNIIGSIFYGNVLGIFLLAFFVKFVRSNSTFMAAIITQIIVLIGWWDDWMPYLWLNMFGCALVMSIAILIEVLSNSKNYAKS
ncbi:sodium:solute symporter [Mesonia sp.]|uniref:sodium:solute symporter n=1 Tax=Mesonia sp. TaxID=1960830 RepID=UPI001753A801|nr:sodium:solute symporter [Mesonia sp.]HIB37235.1 sodium:solute symporter [Mesonia sp.]HIO26760.1 sodium:solute symporter [Flavobacteriaceae bacterium]